MPLPTELIEARKLTNEALDLVCDGFRRVVNQSPLHATDANSFGRIMSAFDTIRGEIDAMDSRQQVDNPVVV
jgi:hypothetical protein